MADEYWKYSPFGEDSIFHPSWEEKQKSRKENSTTYSIPRLVITDKVIDYTCQFIYGATYDIDYESIVIPVYEMKLIKNGRILKTFGVTRDSWYSRGIVNDGFIFDDIELTNRCFEPRDADINLYSTVPLEYPVKGLDAFALRQYGKEQLAAEPHSKRMNTFVDGTPIDDARSNLDIAEGVMIHIGGYYDNGITKKLAGSYGCFGFIPKHQRGSENEMEKWRKKNTYKNVETSNQEYKNFINIVVDVRGKDPLRVLIIKRQKNVPKFKTLKNQ